MDVTLLHHDIGMVRTQYAMILSSLPKADPLISMKRFNPIDLKKEEVTILGFGRKEQDGPPDFRGEALFSVNLQLTFCERGSWFHCICGIASPVVRSQGGGVCTGDSGGPVLYRGSQIAVTSMGPTQCRKLFNSGMQGATSVFTTLYQYAKLINSTITKTDNMLRERKPRTRHDPVKEKCNSTKIHYILFCLSILLCILSSEMKCL
ncbi:chymotrypsin-1-like [Hyposmocoma kahamanoa]|uniref:chymotrypsin-1-like n=1 Tax=Hyposmocoma kahamanoa TaxID=1477025 RepID=UPI000E6D85A8|nr:chymotrypsin-1-like [Hyposmocoma kahamanoa]XP_026326805.1 chymotrypsin-1-like [Hyposmocoma kahamanoa]